MRTVLVLDVQYPEAWTLEVPGDCPGESGGVTAVRENAGLTISNRGDRPVLIEAIEISDIARPIDALVDAGGKITLPLGEDTERVRLNMETMRDVDMLVPRSRSAVRHRAEKVDAAVEPESAWDLVFDLGTLVRRREGADVLEGRLREELEGNPKAVAAAAQLGSLLLKRQELAEAGRWLRVAYNARDTLPDGGRRVRMQLRELARRHALRFAGSPDT